MTRDGTCIHDVVTVGSRALASLRAIFRSISELPWIEPLQRPRMCMMIKQEIGLDAEVSVKGIVCAMKEILV